MRAFLVCGTDTGVGKTVVSAALLAACVRRGGKAACMKPAESGCPRRNGVLEPRDAILLRDAAGGHQDLAEVCPYRFEEPVAPGVAAGRTGVEIQFDLIARSCQAIVERSPDLFLVEGAGGLMVPFGGGRMLADLAVLLRFPLLVVARDNLGTINHSVLTALCARARGIDVAGVILSGSQPGTSPAAVEANAGEIAAALGDVPVLGAIPHLRDTTLVGLAAAAEQFLDLAAILDA